jgi:ribosomal protein S18 acetylase RimI-like enzyme
MCTGSAHAKSCGAFSEIRGSLFQRSMTIRPANPADVQAIASLHVATWRAAYRGQIPDAVLDALSVERRAEYWRKRVTSEKWPVVVAAEGDSVIGFCDLIPSDDKDADSRTVAQIVGMYVSPAHWRKGAGRALCESAQAQARSRGIKTVTLWVLASNTDARHFYERIGFSLDGAEQMDSRMANGVELHLVRYQICL